MSASGRSEARARTSPAVPPRYGDQSANATSGSLPTLLPAPGSQPQQPGTLEGLADQAPLEGPPAPSTAPPLPADHQINNVECAVAWDGQDYDGLLGFAPLCPPTPLPGGATYTILGAPFPLGGPVPPSLASAFREEEPAELHELQTAATVIPAYESPAFQSPVPRASAGLTVTVTPAARRAVEVDAATRDLELRAATIRQQPNGHGQPSPGRSTTDIERDYRKNACDRERTRMRDMNRAYDMLRLRLPEGKKPPKKLSKIECLRLAIEYIRSMERTLGKSDAACSSWEAEGMLSSQDSVRPAQCSQYASLYCSTAVAIPPAASGVPGDDMQTLYSLAQPTAHRSVVELEPFTDLSRHPVQSFTVRMELPPYPESGRPVPDQPVVPAFGVDGGLGRPCDAR